MNKFTISLFLAVISFLGCVDNECSPISDIITEDKQGNTIRRIEYNCNEGVEEYQFIKVGDSIIPHGYYKLYYPSGQLHILNFFKEGVRDSLYLRYSENGVLINKWYRTRGKLYGPQYTYNERGKIDLLRFHLVDTYAFFAIQYDEIVDNEIRRFYGSPVQLMTPSNYYNQLKVGEELVMFHAVPNVNDISTIVNVRLSYFEKNIYDTTTSKFIKMDNCNFFSFEWHFDKMGIYEYHYTIFLKDKKTGKTLLEDTLKRKITVR